MPNNVEPAKYVTRDNLVAFLTQIKSAYQNNASNDFAVGHSGTADSATTASSATTATSATTANALANNIAFIDSNNNSIGTWYAGENSIRLTITGGGGGGHEQDVLRFKGFKESVADLPTAADTPHQGDLAPEVGDVWVIKNDTVGAETGTEYVWTPAKAAEGEEGQEGYKPAVPAHWEKLGINTDLSVFVTNSSLQTTLDNYYTKALADTTFVKSANLEHVTTQEIEALFPEEEEEEPTPEPSPVDPEPEPEP